MEEGKTYLGKGKVGTGKGLGGDLYRYPYTVG